MVEFTEHTATTLAATTTVIVMGAMGTTAAMETITNTAATAVATATMVIVPATASALASETVAMEIFAITVSKVLMEDRRLFT